MSYQYLPRLKKINTQNILIEKIYALVKNFPAFKTAINFNSDTNIPGLCYGLSIAFNLALVENRLGEYLSNYQEICSWNEDLAINEDTLNRWTDFIKKILDYQLIDNLNYPEQVLKSGTKLASKTVVERKSLFGYLDLINLKKVLDNPMVEQVLRLPALMVMCRKYQNKRSNLMYQSNEKS